MKYYYISMLCVCFMSMHGISQEYKDQIKKTYGFDKNKYRAPRNLYNIASSHSPGIYANPFYEIVASILGYKPVTLVPHFTVKKLRKDCKMMRAFVEANPYYMYLPPHGEYIFYSDASYKKALLLAELLLQKWDDIHGNIWYHYLFGKLVGYLERDIRIFIQMERFQSDKGRPLKNDQELYQYIDTMWQERHQDDYKRITDNVDVYIKDQLEHHSADDIKQRIQRLDGADNVTFNKLSSSLLPNTRDIIKYVYNSVDFLQKRIMQ